MRDEGLGKKFESIVSADLIYVLQKGRIIEQGNYDSLTTLDGTFRHTAEIQRIFH
jgi:ABC-type multidrug transport system fused ATPase/permease subunit|tara:strand:- start:134 stop:298 length:165 start_codon:yes stop_codon:yes gene_type:complete